MLTRDYIIACVKDMRCHTDTQHIIERTPSRDCSIPCAKERRCHTDTRHRPLNGHLNRIRGRDLPEFRLFSHRQETVANLLFEFKTLGGISNLLLPRVRLDLISCMVTDSNVNIHVIFNYLVLGCKKYAQVQLGR